MVDVASDPWLAFDRIYCISLAERTDRYQAAKEQFRRVGLGDRVEFHIVNKHPTDTERGIFESHIACLRAGLDAGAKRIAVFEDDILFHRFSARRLQQAASFMRGNPDWRLFFFGCFVNSSRKTSFPSVVKVRYRSTSHGYVVSQNMAAELVATEWRGVPYDVVLRDIGKDQVYAIYPAFAFQSGASTDNEKLVQLDRFRRLIGGMRRLQRWNEFSSRRLVPLIVAHVVIALLLILLVAHHYAGIRAINH